jgi:hypothetical protein
MTPRFLLLSILPLLAIEPGLSSAAGQPLPFAEERLSQELQQAQELARQAGETLARSLQIIESAIPRYGLPYLDDQGNIVIPRRNRASPRGTPIPESGPSHT